MVSKEGSKCALTNLESDSETAPSASLALEVKYSLDASRQVRKRNKALQVRFKDICEAQNEQREAARQAAAGGKPVSYKAAYRKYMTVPARRSIPNVTRSTGVQTSPDLKKRYQTFPFERKKGHGHTIKHVAAVESYRGQNNGFLLDLKQPRAGAEEGSVEGAHTGSGVWRTRALLHTSECMATVEQHAALVSDGPCSDSAAQLLGCGAGAVDSDSLISGAAPQADYQLCSVSSKPRKGLPHGEPDPDRERPSSKRHLINLEEGSSRTLPDRTPTVTGPIAWNSLTQVECLDSPSVRTKRKKGVQLNGLQSQTLPRAGGGGCTTQAQCHSGPFSPQPRTQTPQGAVEEAKGVNAVGEGEACKQIVPVTKEGDVKAQLQAMENLISSSQETIKVLLGVIQELEKGEAHREG